MGYDETIDPIEFHKIVHNNLDKFTEDEKLVILRFFDKLSDSDGFALTCRSKLSKYFMTKKRYKKTAKLIYSKKAAEINIDGVIKLQSCGSDKWNVSVAGDLYLKDITSDAVFKMYKDINTIFNNKYK